MKKKKQNLLKKYQILSKNTSLFAEIPNEESQQSKLIKVNLNEYKNEIPIYPKMMMMMAKAFPGHAPRKMMMAKCAAPTMEMNFATKSFGGATKSMKKASPPPPPPPPPANINKENKEKKDDITSIIMSQDIIEGFWVENTETKKIINIISLEKFNKIKNCINSFYKGQNEMKLIYTVLVIYYLKMKCPERLDEFKLIINKANKYLEKNGINYENIISSL